jgi:hypothetical protein
LGSSLKKLKALFGLKEKVKGKKVEGKNVNGMKMSRK